MACCIFTAYCMNRLIKACELLDLKFLKVQYNEFDDGAHDSLPEAESRVVASKFVLEGLTCAACVSAVQSAVNALDGVQRVSVSLALGRATVVHRQDKASHADIISAIGSKGYEARSGERTAQQNADLPEVGEDLGVLKSAFENATIISFVIYLLDRVAKWRHAASIDGLVRTSIAIMGLWVMIYGARRLHLSAWCRGRSVSMDTLISISLSMSVSLSVLNTVVFGLDSAKVYWSSGVFLTMVILGGRYLDGILRKRSAASFTGLYQLQERCLRAKLYPGKDNNINPERAGAVINAMTLQPMDRISIEPGWLIPCDSYVVFGESMVDQSSMTGEHKPAPKRPGDQLLSGTVNLSSPLVADVLRTQEDSALEELISSITAATETSQTSTVLDTMTSSFVRLILIITISSFVWSMGFSNASLSGFARLDAALERAMAVLASACPCALGLATPSATLAGLDAAWLRGIIVTRGHETFEKLARLTHIVLDKTGTLTTGCLSVSEQDQDLGPQQCLLIAIAERDAASSHPVAQAVFKWAVGALIEDHRCRISTAKVRNYYAESSGIECEIQLEESSRCHAVKIGNASFLKDAGIGPCDIPLHGKDDKGAAHVSIDGSHVASLRLQDTIRPEASAVICSLRSRWDMKLAMLTGDIESEANRVSSSLGIEVLSSQVLPSQKKAYVEDIQTDSPESVVAMVGDGLNDAAALSAADVGIFLSPGRSLAHSPATSTNLQTSNVIITSPNLARVPELLEIATLTTRQAKWNVWWAIAYNVFAVSLALGAAEPWGLRVDTAMAGTMMSASSVSIMALSLWLRWRLRRIDLDVRGRAEGRGRVG